MRQIYRLANAAFGAYLSVAIRLLVFRGLQEHGRIGEASAEKSAATKKRGASAAERHLPRPGGWLVAIHRVRDEEPEPAAGLERGRV